jgi:hypothetical protein
MIRSESRRATIALAFFSLVVSIAAPAAAADGEPDALDLLVEWMSGTFSSAAQADQDPEFFDISLHMTPIWTDREDGRWLYVEQAVSDAQDRPYRQRVYRVSEVAPDLFESTVFTVPDPGAVIGAWRQETPLDELTPDDLTEREGCSILMRRSGPSFVGSTLAWLCTSSLRGAAYATSEVMITPDGMISWDRGFAEDSQQVWGSVKGGYVFDRIVDDPVEGLEGEDATESDGEPDGDGDGEPDGDTDTDTDTDGETGIESEGEKPLG